MSFADVEVVTSEHSETPHGTKCGGHVSCWSGVTDPVIITVLGSCDASSIGKVLEVAKCGEKAGCLVHDVAASDVLLIGWTIWPSNANIETVGSVKAGLTCI